MMEIGDFVQFEFEYLKAWKDSGENVSRWITEFEEGFIEHVYKNGQFVLSDRRDHIVNPRRHDNASVRFWHLPTNESVK